MRLYELLKGPQESKIIKIEVRFADTNEVWDCALDAVSG